MTQYAARPQQMQLAERLLLQASRDAFQLEAARARGSGDRVLRKLRSWPDATPYNRVPVSVERQVQEIVAASGESTASVALRWSIVTALTEQRAELSGSTLWSECLPYFDEAADQICAEAEGDTYRPTLGNDDFLKDIALATGRLLSVGCFSVETRSGVERRRLLRSGVRSLIRGAWCLARAGGHRPYYESHLYRRLLGHFSCESRWTAYRILARAMKQEPSVRGFAAVAWYFDPMLADVSPRLSYLHDMPAKRGAWFVPVDTSEFAVRSALAKSEHRRRLHSEGKYVPREYLMIWPRRAMLSAFGL